MSGVGLLVPSDRHFTPGSSTVTPGTSATLSFLFTLWFSLSSWEEEVGVGAHSALDFPVDPQGLGLLRGYSAPALTPLLPSCLLMAPARCPAVAGCGWEYGHHHHLPPVWTACATWEGLPLSPASVQQSQGPHVYPQKCGRVLQARWLTVPPNAMAAVGEEWLPLASSRWALQPAFSLGILPVAAVTDSRRLSGLKQHKCIISQFQRVEVETGSPWARVKALAGLLPPGALGCICVLGFSGF